MEVKIYKDGKGNVVVTEDYFRNIMYNLKDANIKSYRNSVLSQKILIIPISDNYYLTKMFEHQPDLISWYNGDEIVKINELFKDTVLIRKPINISELKPITGETPIIEDTEPLGTDEDGWVVCKQENEPWKIEVAFRSEGDYLTISEDGINNRPWTEEEIELINNTLNKLKLCQMHKLSQNKN